MTSPGFNLSDLFRGVGPPLYVRKVDRKGHWETPKHIIENVFPPEPDGTISIWRVDNVTALQRVAVALNANRVATNPKGVSLAERLFLLALKPDELGEFDVVQVDGQTDCAYAKRCHFDVRVSNQQQVSRLVNALLSVGREPATLTKGVMKQAAQAVEAQGCYAVVPDSDGCECEERS